MDNFHHIIEQDRLELLLKFPLFGKCICHCEIQPIKSQNKLSCNDCRRIYLAAEIYCRLPREQRLALLAHEVTHIVLRHPFRLGNREIERFDFAADAEISFLLEKEKFASVYRLPIDPAWEGLTAEEIYERLPEKLPSKVPEHWYPGVFFPVAISAGQINSSINDDSGGKAINVLDSSGNSDAYSGFDAETELFCCQLAQTAKQSLALRSDGYGNGSGGILDVLDKLDNSRVDWRNLLHQFIRDCRGGSYHWLPPNRRYASQGLYFPGRRQKEFCGIIALDTSGSNVIKLPDFVGEVEKLLHSFGKFSLKILECDTVIHQVTEITSNQTPHDWYNHRFAGGGGTDFTPVFHYIRDNRLHPEVLIFFTDGYGECPKQRPPYPVLWLLTENGEVTVDWGISVKMRD